MARVYIELRGESICLPKLSYTICGNQVEIMMLCMKQSRLIRTDATCVQVRDKLMTVMDNNDRLFVGKLSGEAAWNNVICENEFLKEHL